MSDKTVISTEHAPSPAPMFSQGVRKGGFLQVAGQGAVDPVTGKYVGIGDVAIQTRRVLDNIHAILVAGGATLDDVLMFRVYLTTRADFPDMNAAYAAWLHEHLPSGAYPARTTVFVDLPSEDMLVEIDALAVPD